MATLVSHAHSSLAALSFVVTLAWLLVVVLGSGSPSRWLYVAAMTSTGLVGLSGLATMILGGWWSMVFPYAGLAAVAVHGAAGANAKRSLAAGRRGTAAAAAVLQVLALTAAYGLMATKP